MHKEYTKRNRLKTIKTMQLLNENVNYANTNADQFHSLRDQGLQPGKHIETSNDNGMLSSGICTPNEDFVLGSLDESPSKP